MTILVAYRGIPGRTAFGLSFSNAFRRLGHDVHEYGVDFGGPRDFREIPDKVDLLVYVEMNDHLPRYLELEAVPTKKIYVDYDIACDPTTESVLKGIKFDYIFTAHKSYMDYFRGFAKTFFAPCAYDCDRLFPMDIPKSGVALIGHVHGRREAFFREVSRIAGIPIPYIQAYEEEYCRAINGLQIHVSMNDNNPGMIVSRIPETLGCKTFTLCDEGHGVEEVYTPGTDLVTYHNEWSCADLIRYYLAHSDECERIAENGFNVASRYHTYDCRAKQILEAVGA